MNARLIQGSLGALGSLLLLVLLVPSTESAVAAGTAPIRYGVFDDANLYSVEKNQKTVAELKGRGFDGLMLSNGTVAQVSRIAEIADELGGISLVAGPAAELNATWWANGPRPTLANAHA